MKGKYVRLNPVVNRELPSLDDFGAMPPHGVLDQVKAEYLNDGMSTKDLNDVKLTLLATCFYFHTTDQVNEKNAVILKGNYSSRRRQSQR